MLNLGLILRYKLVSNFGIEISWKASDLANGSQPILNTGFTALKGALGKEKKLDGSQRINLIKFNPFN